MFVKCVRVCFCLRCFSGGYDYSRSSAASFHSLCRQERACITPPVPRFHSAVASVALRERQREKDRMTWREKRWRNSESGEGGHESLDETIPCPYRPTQTMLR